MKQLKVRVATTLPVEKHTIQGASTKTKQSYLFSSFSSQLWENAQAR